jgi:hypothetical protein
MYFTKKISVKNWIYSGQQFFYRNYLRLPFSHPVVNPRWYKLNGPNLK